MKKRQIKNLAINKKTISKISSLEELKGGRNSLETSLLCIHSVCGCGLIDALLK
jgi:hypothetical protein